MPIIVWVVGLFILISVLSIYYQVLILRFYPLRLFLFVGIFIHEFAHYLACRLTFAKVRYFKVGLREGHVTHQKSPIPILGGLFISLAPMIFGIVSLILLNLWLVGWGYDEIVGKLQNNWQVNAQLFFSSINYLSWKIWVYLFLLYNILATFAPSTQDYKNVVLGLLGWIAVSYFTPWLDTINLFLVYGLSFAAGFLILFIGVLSLLRTLWGAIWTRNS